MAVRTKAVARQLVKLAAADRALRDKWWAEMTWAERRSVLKATWSAGGANYRQSAWEYFKREVLYAERKNGF